MASAEVSAQSDVPPAAAGPELPRLGAAAGGMPCYDAQSVAALVAYLRGRAGNHVTRIVGRCRARRQISTATEFLLEALSMRS